MSQPGQWVAESGKDSDKFTWIYRLDSKGQKEYLSSIAGRISIDVAKEILPLLNNPPVVAQESFVKCIKWYFEDFKMRVTSFFVGGGYDPETGNRIVR